jgi:AraC-like DNA-binding protein
MIESPKNLTDHPKVGGPASPDLLSHVLAQIRLTGDLVYSCTLAPRERLALETEVAHVCIVTQGTLRIESGENGLMVIESGDLMMLRRGAGDRQLTANDAPTTIVLCRFQFDADSLRGLVSGLPGCIHIRKAESAGWLEGIVHFLMIEAGDSQPGAALMVSRLIDLVVIRTLRSWIQRGPASGWLGGLSDVRIANALKAIHEQPMQRWNIETLSAIAGMSRSSFCERFAALVGRSPLRYQNEWRLTLARDWLAKRKARVGEIGLSIGYESEAAFSRAYKALFGHSPRVDYGQRHDAHR